MSTESQKLDSKITAWLEQQRVKALKEAETENRVMSSRTVTISREFGCEGYPLAVALKEILEDASGDKWTIFDRNLIEKLEREYDLTKEFLEKLGEKASAVERLKAMLSRSWAKDNEDKFRMIADTIFSIASAGHAIIVGRGSAVIAQELPNCFHFRLIAPLEHRIKSYMLRTGCTKDDAASAVLEAHANTSTFSKDFLGVDLTDPLYYHAIFNTERMKLSSIAVAVSKVIGY